MNVDVANLVERTPPMRSEDTPKTELCCGLKPKRVFYQTAFRDDEGFWTFTCRKKCGKSVRVENNYRGTSKAELEATIKWNNIVKTEDK